MPRAKSLSHYPARYGEIVAACALRAERIDVPLETVELARKLRGHYYAYKGALMRAAEDIAAQARSHPLVPLTPGMKDTIELAKQSETVILTIIEEPELTLDGTATGKTRAIVRFENRENSWQARALAGASTESGKSRPTSTELDAIAARLAALKPEPDNGN